MSNTFPNRAILKDGKVWLLIDSRDLSTTKSVCEFVNCKYHINSGMFELPLTYMNVKTLMDLKFEFGKTLRDWERITRQEKENNSVKLKNIKGLNGTLRPFQARGVEFIDEVEGRALVADDMGLGKTIQAIAWCQLHVKERPVLVICPSSVKISWQRMADEWMDVVNVQILEGRTPYEIAGDFVIINYDILSSWKDELKQHGFKVLIADEAHYIRKSTSQRTKAFKALAKYFERIIALTGTPIENYPVDIYNIVNILNPKIFPNYYDFTKRFCDARNDLYSRNVQGVSNPEELYRILTKTVMIRRKKSEVLTDLPPKTICVLPLEIDNKKEYQKAENEFISYLSQKFNKDLLEKDGIEKELKAYAKLHKIEISDDLDNDDLTVIHDTKIEKAKNAPVLVQMNHLKQLAVRGKMKSLIEWITDFLQSGEKLVVFTLNVFVVDEFMKVFPDAARLDGSVSKSNRQKAIDRFQNNDDCKLFISNMDAGGIGITLTSASNVLTVQYPWLPGKFAQAPDRVHRMTQLKRVTVWNAIGINTIEEKIIKVLVAKEKTNSDILDGGKMDNGSIASEIIKMYKIK